METNITHIGTNRNHEDHLQIKRFPEHQLGDYLIGVGRSGLPIEGLVDQGEWSPNRGTSGSGEVVSDYWIRGSGLPIMRLGDRGATGPITLGTSQM